MLEETFLITKVISGVIHCGNGRFCKNKNKYVMQLKQELKEM